MVISTRCAATGRLSRAGSVSSVWLPAGTSFDYDFIAPDAGTYWYHPHSRTWEQLARGLYGMLIVEERQPLDFDLDLPLVIDDWRLTEQGAIHEPSFGAMMDKSHAGRLGNWETVNGASGPMFKVPTNGLVRLRLANASNARVLRLKTGNLNGQVIALDGQPLTNPTNDDEVVALAPGVAGGRGSVRRAGPCTSSVGGR